MTHPQTRVRRTVSLSLAAVVAASSLLVQAPIASADPVACVMEGRALQVTPDCVDATYATPIIDSQSDETSPVAHRRISGHFEGTNIEFTIYLHAVQNKGDWEGRFFQFTYPTAFTPEEDTSRASDRAIEFALSSGGYAVQAGNASISLGYRHTAAAAKFAEGVAADYYGSEAPIHGYLYGPSGGSFQTVGAAENTVGIWEGFVPMVQGVPMSMPYNALVRSAAELILGEKAEQIQAALMPGGSGDPYDGLDAAEAAMLTEMHAFGVPWEGWEFADYLLGYSDQFPNGLSNSEPLGYDPTYVVDFWTKDGYLGTEQSALGERVRAELAAMGDTTANRWNVANRFYYRHQLPPADQGWIGFDQFRDADNAPLYPQRSFLIGPLMTGGVSGNTPFDGSITGKMIAVSNLYDTDALPIHTDWYRQRVEASLGTAAEDHLRVYFNDHADHQDAPVVGERATHLVNWYGMVEQALRDVAAWAEDGVEPPRSTKYVVEDSQIVVPDNSAARRGIQPVVDLSVRGKDLIRVRAGEPVKLQAKAQVPPGTGKILRVEWDLDGDGVYMEAPLARIGGTVTVQRTASFTTPGTYFVAVRVTSERDGDANATVALSQNLDRVQVVVG